MNKEKFTNLVKDDKDAMEDRGGETPLFSLAITPELVEILSTLELSEFSVDELKTLNRFIFLGECTETEKSSISANYLRNINENLRGENASNKNLVYRRGLLYRFISALDDSGLPIDQVLADADLKQQEPWMWVDCIWRQRWETACDEIGKMLQTGTGELSSLLRRLFLYNKNRTETEFEAAINKWFAKMNSADQNKMKKWLETWDLPSIKTADKSAIEKVEPSQGKHIKIGDKKRISFSPHSNNKTTAVVEDNLQP